MTSSSACLMSAMGCRRCVSLCDAFPTLFDLIDESETMEVDGVNKSDYQNVAEQCYMCDLCYLNQSALTYHHTNSMSTFRI